MRQLEAGASVDYKTKTMILKLNHIIFWWYYKRVPEHFRQWTLLKSIEILVSNYNHAQWEVTHWQKANDRTGKMADIYYKKIKEMEFEKIGVTKEQALWAKNVLGLDIPSNDLNN